MDFGLLFENNIYLFRFPEQSWMSKGGILKENKGKGESLGDFRKLKENTKQIKSLAQKSVQYILKISTEWTKPFVASTSKLLLQQNTWSSHI